MPAGRSPKPTNVHKLNGNPSKLDLKNREATEPQPPEGEVSPPEWLSDAALEEWEYFLPILKAMNVLTVADRDALAIMCEHVADFAFYRKKIAELREIEEYGKGEVVTTVSGYATQSPYVNMAVTASNMAKKYMACFGLDPAARTKIEVDKGTEKQERVKPTPRRGVAS